MLGSALGSDKALIKAICACPGPSCTSRYCVPSAAVLNAASDAPAVRATMAPASELPGPFSNHPSENVKPRSKLGLSTKFRFVGIGELETVKVWVVVTVIVLVKGEAILVRVLVTVCVDVTWTVEADNVSVTVRVDGARVMLDVTVAVAEQVALELDAPVVLEPVLIVGVELVGEPDLELVAVVTCTVLGVVDDLIEAVDVDVTVDALVLVICDALEAFTNPVDVADVEVVVEVLLVGCEVLELDTGLLEGIVDVEMTVDVRLLVSVDPLVEPRIELMVVLVWVVLEVVAVLLEVDVVDVEVARAVRLVVGTRLDVEILDGPDNTLVVVEETAYFSSTPGQVSPSQPRICRM
jgi:hypothetical protein